MNVSIENGKNYLIENILSIGITQNVNRSSKRSFKHECHKKYHTHTQKNHRFFF